MQFEPRKAKELLDNSELFMSTEDIHKLISDLASSISNDMSQDFPLILPVMNGGLVIAGHLLPLLNFPLQLDYIHVTRYQGKRLGGDINWLSKPKVSVKGRRVLIIDDILDKGNTAHTIVRWLRNRGASNVSLCVLLDKDIPENKPISADYVGVNIPDKYVFGFGMDIHEFWRNMPAIYVYKGEEG